MKYKVVYSYKAQRSDELTIKISDIIENVEVRSGGWASGIVDDRRGLFPLNHTIPLLETQYLDSSTSAETYKVIYPYRPSNEEELELLEGYLIEVTSKDDSGWWFGSCMGKQGIFPSNFVSGPIGLQHSDVSQPILEEESPVVMRRRSNNKPKRSSKVMSFHASIDQNIGSSSIFAPEDEPHDTMFGSLTSQFDWSTASLSSFKATPGRSFFQRMKQSMSTKSLFPKFLSGRLSSNSLNDKSSIGSSSYRRRRNSFASFFQNSPAHRSREEGYSDKFLPGLRLNTSTPKLKSNEDFRKSSISSFSGRKNSRSTEQSASWVFQESSIFPNQADHATQTYFRSEGDSGIIKDVEMESPDEIFGPIVEMNDEVFDDIFDNKNLANEVKAQAEGPKKPGEKKRLSLTMIKTTLSPFEKRMSLGVSKRNSIKTNPNTNWKEKDESKPRLKVEVTEL